MNSLDSAALDDILGRIRTMRITSDDRHHFPQAHVKLRGQLAALEAAMDQVMREGG